MTFATLQDDFAKLNTKLVGLSIDGLYSHIAWLRTIKDKITYRGMSNVEVTFPLIEDITMEIARKYGMIMPGEDSTKAVRAVFVIDMDGTDGMNDGVTCIDWFFCTKELSEHEIDEAILAR